MNAHQLFRDGRLTEALEAQLAEVRSNPTDVGRRLFLFELMVFQGELDRAKRQLDMLEFNEPELKAAHQDLKLCLGAETKRREVLQGKAEPRFLTEKSESLAKRLEAAAKLAAGDDVAAGELLAQAMTVTTTVKANVNGTAVEDFRDADDLFSHVLEVFAKGEYFWVPWELVERISSLPPKTPRDLFWLPVHLEVQGASADVRLPALYAFSHNHPDPLVRLGRQTEWLERDGGVVCGVGLKTFLLGEDALSLWDIRDYLDDAVAAVPLNAPDDEPAPEGPAAEAPPPADAPAAPAAETPPAE